jgi:diguanylate cyclase (GGDEF)-like protein
LQRGSFVLLRKIFAILYRFTLPGSLLLAVIAVLVRIGAFPQPDSQLVRFMPPAVFLTGLVMSAVFRRSRLFFAILAVALVQTILFWTVPQLPPVAGFAVTNAIIILLPLNLAALAFLRERGIISPAGRKRLAFAALQVIALALLSFRVLAEPASLLGRPLVPEVFSRWSHLSQLALLAFVVATALVVVPLFRRYRAVESGLLWTLVSAFIAFRMGPTTPMAGVYMAMGGLALIVALLETSYSMAYHDELTQLPSRRAFNEALMKLPESYTIAMVDVDHFKKFNDSYGHEAGDQALRLVASRLAHVTGGGRAYRYGGEEFAVVFPGKAAEDVHVFLDRLRRLIEQSTFIVRGKDRRKNRAGKTRVVAVKKETNVTVSIGVAATHGDRLTPAEVLRVADHALYRAKAKGRNCTVAAKQGKASGSVQPSMKIVSVS